MFYTLLFPILPLLPSRIPLPLNSSNFIPLLLNSPNSIPIAPVSSRSKPIKGPRTPLRYHSIEMLGCWILLSILPLLSIAIAFCGKSRETAHPNRSQKSVKKAGQKTKNGKSAPKSARSKKSASKSSKSGKSSKSKKSSKSAKKSAKSASKSNKSPETLLKGGSQKEKSAKPAKTQVVNSLKKQSQQEKPTQESQVSQPTAKPIEIRAEPQEVSFKSTGGLQKFNVVNNTGERRVFKVKCSDNQLYRVHPVYCVIEAGKTGVIEVLRNNGANKMDKLVLLSVKTDDVPADFKDFFNKTGSQQQHMMAVPLIVDA